jgi:CysZ protein
MTEFARDDPRRPGFPRRAAAGAWHVPAGFAYLVRHPRLWPFAALPAALACLLVFLGAVLGVFLGRWVETALSPAPGRVPVWLDLLLSLLLWTAAVGAGIFLGLGIALLLAAPLLDQLSRQVEAQAGGTGGESGRGLRWEIGQSLRGALYFLVAAPGVFVLGFIPVVGPLLSVMWGARAVAFQMTDPALTRRGLSFREKRRWHREWLPESQGFGLAGMLGLLVPFANFVLAPALVAGGTLLVLSLEDVGRDAAPPRSEAPSEPGAPPPP